MPKVGRKHCRIEGCANEVVKRYSGGRFKNYLKSCSQHHGYLTRRGPLNPSWKGGRLVSKDGYILVLDSMKYVKGGISRYSLEHRLVMERKLERPLAPDEIVHHLNGIRADNRPENLALIKKSPDGRTNHETWTYPRALQARIRELEALVGGSYA